MLQYFSASSIPELGFLYQCSLTIPYTVQMNASFSQLSGCCPYTYCALLLVWPLAISPGLKTCSLLPMRSASTTLLPLHNPLAPQKKTTAVSEGHEGCQFIHTRHYLSLWSDIPGKLGAEQHGYRLAPIQLSRLDFLFFSDAPRQFKGLYGTFKPLQSHLIKSHNLPPLNILQL